MYPQGCILKIKRNPEFHQSRLVDGGGTGMVIPIYSCKWSTTLGILMRGMVLTGGGGRG